MTVTKVKIRPSSSGFMQGDLVYTTYSSGCLRYMKAARKAKYVPLDPMYAEVGLVHEERHATRLGERLAEREYVIKQDIDDNSEYSGRCDFIDTDGAIHETKATFSKSSKYSIIGKGEFQTGHLAQLASYMVALKRDTGYIVVGYYEQDKENLVCIAERVFKVTINNIGTLLVDGEETEFSLMDSVAHMRAQAALDDTPMPSRPYSVSYFKSPCAMCPLQTLCDSVDIGETKVEDFPTLGAGLIESTPARPAKINQKGPRTKELKA